MENEANERTTPAYDILLYRYINEWSDVQTNGAALDRYGNIVTIGSSAVKLSHCGEVLSFTYDGTGVAVDGGCNVYIVGTAGDGLPVTPGAYQTVYPGTECGFIVKLDPMGEILYASYFGSAYGAVVPLAVNVDENGCALITGYTNTPDFPSQALWPDGRGSTSAFILKFDLKGNGPADLLYGYALGGNAPTSSVTRGWSVKAEAGGACFVAGETSASNFFTTPGAIRSTFQGESEGFIVKLSFAGDLLYSTYIGGSGSDKVTGAALGAQHSVYITGETNSPNLATPGAFQADVNGMAAYASKLLATGNRYDVEYFTYLGAGPQKKLVRQTPQFDQYEVNVVTMEEVQQAVNRIAVDQNGCAYVAGNTSSEYYGVPFPITADALYPEHHNVDAFITKFSPNGSSVLYSSYLGAATKKMGEGVYTETVIDPNNPLRMIITRYYTSYNRAQNVSALAVDNLDNIMLAGSIASECHIPTGLTKSFCNWNFFNAGYVLQLGETPPDWPEGSQLTVTALDASTLRMDWSAASGSVDWYRIYQDEAVLDTVAGDVLAYTVVNAPSVSRYFYSIEAGTATGSFSCGGPRRLLKYPLGLCQCNSQVPYVAFNPKTMKRICPLYQPVNGRAPDNKAGAMQESTVLPSYEINDGMIAPDSKTAVLTDEYYGSLRLMDLPTLTLTDTPLENVTYCAGITPDSRFALVNAQRGDPVSRSVTSFDLQNRRAVFSMDLPGTVLGVSPNGNNLVLANHAGDTALRVYVIDAQGRLSDTGAKVTLPLYPKSCTFSKDGRYAFVVCQDEEAAKLVSLRIGSPGDIVITSMIAFNAYGSQPIVSCDCKEIYSGILTEIWVYGFDLLTETLAYKNAIPIPYQIMPAILWSRHLFDLNQEEDRLFIPYYNNPMKVIGGGGTGYAKAIHLDGTDAGRIPDSMDPLDVLIRPVFRSDMQAPVWPDNSSLTAYDVSSRSLMLRWTPAQDPEGVLAYRIYVNSNPMADVAENVTEFSVKGLRPDTLYQFNVEAEGREGIWTFYGPSVKARTLREGKLLVASITIVKL